MVLITVSLCVLAVMVDYTVFADVPPCQLVVNSMSEYKKTSFQLPADMKRK